MERSIKQEYLNNTVADDVKKWTITHDVMTADDDNIPVASADAYEAGRLYKNVMIDEEGNAVVEYKDKEGLVILKKVQIGTIESDYSGYGGFLCTYYVYDDLNLLRFVIPPKAVEAIKTNWSFYENGTTNLHSTVIDELCFRYEYDQRGRMISKKVPGAGWMYMVYDNRDRLVYTQDANMRIRNQWLATIYDEFNRPVMTGMLAYSGSRTDLQLYVAGSGGNSGAGAVTAALPEPLDLYINNRETGRAGYNARSTITFSGEFESEASASFTAEIDNNPLPVVEQVHVMDSPLPSGYDFIALTINYYDNYSWTNKSYNNSNNSKLTNVGNNIFGHAEGLPSVSSQQTKGMVTGTKVRVLENPDDLSQGVLLTTVNFYDDKGRVIQRQAENYKGGTDVLTSHYDFTGKILNNYFVHNNPASNINQVTVKTDYEFDAGGRLTAVWKTVNNDNTRKVLISTSEYDQLGQLSRKLLGRKKDATGAYTLDALETLDYTYNIRGWINGINKDYISGPSASTRWFGMELSYDWGFTSNLFNGNIAGMKWRSKGDGEKRAYGFSYDKANRVMAGDFSQHDGNAYSDNSAVNYDMMMGNGVDASSAYDENGNIKAMKQWGLKLGSSSLIDDLTYSYNDQSNKLSTVRESSIIGNTDNKLGDFTDRGGYYDYDQNGNLVIDNNKHIYDYYNIDGGYAPGIFYNHLNLPYKIMVHLGPNESLTGSIVYIYDAAGNKLEKRVSEPNETAEKNSVTTYLGEFIYQDDQLQFFGHEEGRARFHFNPLGLIETGIESGETIDHRYEWNFDYFIKDHLGNVRMVLTDEKKTDTYQAGMEQDKREFETALFGNKIAQTASLKPGGFDTDGNNQKVSAVSGSSAENRIGPGVILKVMAGDKIKARTYAWYQYNGDHSVDGTLPAMIGNVLGQLVPGIAGAGKGTVAVDVSSDLLQPGMQNLLDGQNPASDRPKAYLNWIAFDEEQFKKVDGNFGSTQVPLLSAGDAKQLLEAVPSDGEIEIKKNGYIYIYVSNESRQNVYFDDIHIEHIRGALLEETHYYPFGLTMAAISSKAQKEQSYPDNKIKFTSQEFDEDYELNWYQLKFRNLDPQIGRFVQIDPLASSYSSNSTFAYAENDVIRAVDMEGLEKFIITADPQLEGASIISYDPTPIKGLAGRYQVVDTRKGQEKTLTDAFPEVDMQKNMGGSYVDGQGNLYIKGDDDPNLKGAKWDLKDFQNPITGDDNPRDGNNKPFTIIAGNSDATPIKDEDRNVTDQIQTLSADQSASGTFEKSSGTITHNFNIPSSSTDPKISIMTDDGGTYKNNFIVSSAGIALSTIKNSGTANVTAPANSVLNVSVTGVPGLGLDIYNINIRITTTKKVTVQTIDRSKL